MTRIQTALLIVVIAAFGFLTFPRYMEQRRAQRAISDLEVLADGARQYLHHVGDVCSNPQALLENPGVSNWKGPYLSSNIPTTPWGGEYVFDTRRGVVGLDPNNPRVPERYRLGGIAELSQPIRDGPQWWPSNGVLP